MGAQSVRIVKDSRISSNSVGVNIKLNIKYLAHIADKSSFVFIPISREVFFFWELVTAQFESDLETVRSQIIIILHSTWHRIPICSVCDAVLKFASMNNIIFEVIQKSFFRKFQTACG